MIAAERLTKLFGNFRAVDDVSFSIPKGQIVGLLGPNGAGKTTTIRMITGYTPPSAGSVSVGGHDTIRESMKARRILGYLPEAAPLYPEMRVVEYLDHRARLFGLGRRERGPAVDRVVERCWLGEMCRRRIGQLSKGYRQRVGLASTLLHNPPVLILDEPTSGLDPGQIRETRRLIRELATDRTVLVSSHILPEVERTCDRVIIIARGRVRADGTPHGLVEEMSGVSAYTVEIQGGGGDGAKGSDRGKMLGRIAGVASARTGGDAMSVENDGGWQRFLVTPHPDAPDLREAIARAALVAGLLVRELHRERPSLEQFFMSVIEDEPGQSSVPRSDGGREVLPV